MEADDGFRLSRRIRTRSRALAPDGCDQVALVLQGGGALGAYQAGVYQALHEAGLEPDRVAGVSIGGINGAIIAGNPPERRAARGCANSGRRSPPARSGLQPDGDDARKVRNLVSLLTMTLGQPGFSRRAFRNPWFSLRGATTATAFTTPRRCGRRCCAWWISIC